MKKLLMLCAALTVTSLPAQSALIDRQSVIDIPPPVQEKFTNQAPKQNETDNKKASTFTEQAEPSILIKPLSREQQEAKEKESLTNSIKKISLIPDSPVAQKWDVVATDVRLANTFERWAQKAGWRVQWDASKHFLIDGASTFTGTFEDAIKAALMTPGIRLGAYPLEACVYGNTPPLIRITRQGEQTQECPDQ